MKKINQTVKAIVVIAIVTAFVSCKKETYVSKPQPLSTSQNEIRSITNTGSSYAGTSTLGDTAIKKTTYTSGAVVVSALQK